MLDAPNFAPRRPFEKIRDGGRFSDEGHRHSDFVSILRELHFEAHSQNIEERRQIAETGKLMANVRSGKLIMKRDPIYGGIALVKPLTTSSRRDRHLYPLAQLNSSQLTSIWSLSNPRVVVREFGGSNRSTIVKALLEDLIGYYHAKYFDELFNQRESLSMMDYGTSLIRIYYDKTLNTIKHSIPTLAEKQKTVFPGYGFCLTCSAEGDEDYWLAGRKGKEKAGPPQCPECGSFAVSDIIPAVSASVTEIEEVIEYEQGDIGIEQLPVPACNWDMRKLPHESSFFTYRSEVSVRLIKSILGIDVDTADPDSDYGLSIMNRLGYRGGAVDGFGRDQIDGTSGTFRGKVALMDEEYYSPDWYADIKLSKSEKTLSGETIPAGVPLGEIFPDGLTVIGFNDMSTVAGVYNEKRRIYGGVYYIQSFSGVGGGTQAAVEVVEQINEIHSANLAIIKRYAGGGYWYDKDVLTKTEAKELLKPTALVGISVRNTPYNSVENAIGQIRHNELNNSNLNMIAQLSNLMNIAFQNTDFTSGVINDNININTARGQEILAAQNQQRAAAPLRMKGWLRARTGEAIIDLFKECQVAPRFIPTGDKYQLSKGRYVAGSELPERVLCDFVADTELPSNTYSKRMNAERMLEKSQYFGVPFIQLAAASPRMAAWWASQFQTDIPLFNYNEILVVCQQRLDELKQKVAEYEQIAQMAGLGTEDLQQVAQEIVSSLSRKIYPAEENHQIKAQVIAEYLDDDEAIEWSPLMRAAVEALISAHYTAAQNFQFSLQALEAQGQAGLQSILQAPQMDAAFAAKAQQEQMMANQAAINEQQNQSKQEAEMEKIALKSALKMAEDEDAHRRNLEAASLSAGQTP